MICITVKCRKWRRAVESFWERLKHRISWNFTEFHGVSNLPPGKMLCLVSLVPISDSLAKQFGCRQEQLRHYRILRCLDFLKNQEKNTWVLCMRNSLRVWQLKMINTLTLPIFWTLTCYQLIDSLGACGFVEKNILAKLHLGMNNHFS